jgi:hypothetical protein
MRQTKTTDENPETGNNENTLKLGLFQLQTKSFWISLISILCLFLVIMTYVNYYFYNKTIDRVLQHEETIIKSIAK